MSSWHQAPVTSKSSSGFPDGAYALILTLSPSWLVIFRIAPSIRYPRVRVGRAPVHSENRLAEAEYDWRAGKERTAAAYRGSPRRPRWPSASPAYPAMRATRGETDTGRIRRPSVAESRVRVPAAIASRRNGASFVQSAANDE